MKEVQAQMEVMAAKGVSFDQAIELGYIYANGEVDTTIVTNNSLTVNVTNNDSNINGNGTKDNNVDVNANVKNVNNDINVNGKVTNVNNDVNDNDNVTK